MLNAQQSQGRDLSRPTFLYVEVRLPSKQTIQFRESSSPSFGSLSCWLRYPYYSADTAWLTIETAYCLGAGLFQ